MMRPRDGRETGPNTAPPDASPAGWYVLTLLTIIAALSLIDRQLPFVMAESIKRDLALSDGQLGMIGGFGFSLFYTLLGLPAARLADRFSRKWVVFPAVVVWSVVTAISGLSASFAQLFLSRIGIAIGEAGCVAPSHSLIADYFSPARRGLAMSIFAVGGTLGLMAGFALGGMLSDAIGWRATFAAFGLPGLAVGLLGAFTVREPTRVSKRASAAPPAMLGAAADLLRKPTYRYVCLAASAHGFAITAIMAWLSPFLIRSHGLSTGQAGMLTGLLTGAIGTIGILLGGVVSDRLAGRDLRWPLWFCAAAALGSAPLFIIGFAAPSLAVVMVALLPAALIGFSTSGPVFATVQNLADPRERATASAIIVLLVGLIAGAGGPAFGGMLSDALAPAFGASSLSVALCITTGIASPLGAFFFFAAASSAERDIPAATISASE